MSMPTPGLQLGFAAATLACLLCLTAYGNKVYRTVDEAGIPVFSDHEEPDSAGVEEVILQETVTYPGESPSQEQGSPGLAETASEPFSQQEPGYTELAISHPSGDSVVRENSGTLPLMVTITPDLHPDHTVELLMDSRTIRTLQAAGEVTLTSVDRGTHEFSVRILNKNAQEIASSAVTRITVLRASRIKPPH